MPLLHKNPRSRLCLYADYSNLITSGKTINVIGSTIIVYLQLKTTLTVIINLDKTSLITFYKKQSRNKLNPCICMSIIQTKIKQVTETKFLALFINENLS